jgi:hypothetical protein
MENFRLFLSLLDRYEGPFALSVSCLRPLVTSQSAKSRRSSSSCAGPISSTSSEGLSDFARSSSSRPERTTQAHRLPRRRVRRATVTTADRRLGDHVGWAPTSDRNAFAVSIEAAASV